MIMITHLQYIITLLNNTLSYNQKSAISHQFTVEYLGAGGCRLISVYAIHYNISYKNGNDRRFNCLLYIASFQEN